MASHLRFICLSLSMVVAMVVLATSSAVYACNNDGDCDINPPDNENPIDCPLDCGGGGGSGGSGGTCTDGVFCNPLQFDTIEDLLRAILQAVILIAFPIIVLFLVLAGFKFVTAQGNPKNIEDARKLFFYTLIGALVVLGAQALSYAIQETVNELM